MAEINFPKINLDIVDNNNIVYPKELSYETSNIIDYTDNAEWKDLFRNLGGNTNINQLENKILTYVRIAELIMIRNFLWQNFVKNGNSIKLDGKDTLTNKIKDTFNQLYKNLLNNNTSATLIEDVKEQTKRIETDGANNGEILFYVNDFDATTGDLYFRFVLDYNNENRTIKVQVEDDLKEFFMYLIKNIENNKFLMSTSNLSNIEEAQIHTHIIAYI